MFRNNLSQDFAASFAGPARSAVLCENGGTAAGSIFVVASARWRHYKVLVMFRAGVRNEPECRNTGPSCAGGHDAVCLLAPVDWRLEIEESALRFSAL